MLKLFLQKMDFKQLIAKYVTGNIPSDKLSEIGIAGLNENLDSPSLYILAGLDKAENSFVAERYLNLTLEELGMQMPDKRQAALIYALAITNEIIDGTKDLISGIREIKAQAVDSYNFWSENSNYVYDSIGFEKVYGLYDDYDNLTDITPPLKRDQEYINQIKVQLFDELKIWKERLEILVN